MKIEKIEYDFEVNKDVVKNNLELHADLSEKESIAVVQVLLDANLCCLVVPYEIATPQFFIPGRIHPYYGLHEITEVVKLLQKEL